MSIVPPVVPDDDTLSIECPDWAIPCDYSQHERLSTESAIYAVWSTPTRPCGCPTNRSFSYICNRCWVLMLEKGVYCVRCYVEYPVMESVARVERI